MTVQSLFQICSSSCANSIPARRVGAFGAPHLASPACPGMTRRSFVARWAFPQLHEPRGYAERPSFVLPSSLREQLRHPLAPLAARLRPPPAQATPRSSSGGSLRRLRCASRRVIALSSERGVMRSRHGARRRNATFTGLRQQGSTCYLRPCARHGRIVPPPTRAPPHHLGRTPSAATATPRERCREHGVAWQWHPCAR